MSQDELDYVALGRKLREKAEAREKERQQKEPPPAAVYGEAYVPMVNEIKRLATEYDLFEERAREQENQETEFNFQESLDKLKSETQAVGTAIHQLGELVGGVQLMQFTLNTYVRREVHSIFGMHFNGIGEWRA